jgi:hypothetical protein
MVSGGKMVSVWAQSEVERIHDSKKAEKKRIEIGIGYDAGMAQEPFAGLPLYADIALLGSYFSAGVNTLTTAETRDSG